jgi:serine/threonine-protein kinase
MIGRTLSHYEITEPLGQGGMGVVYRARDQRLGRDVALKVIAPGLLADESARRRFQQEAQAAARISHPFVGNVFDFGTEADVDYLVMEYVVGESLERRISRGPLPEDEAIAIGAQVGEALAALHEAGILHCDLKPANVIVTPRGHAKVLDFGLARLLLGDARRSSDGLESSAPGLAGTLAYMAPEQLLGEEPTAAVDLYALGVLLYEMATGRKPHEEQLPAAMIYTVVNHPVSPPRRLRPGLSTRLEEIILKALEKDALLRYRTAADLLVDLRRAANALGAAEGAGPVAAFGNASGAIRSLAVLPLENLSGDPAQEFFADGMTEALIARLAQIRALRVISRTSAMQYKGARKPLPEIARALHVDAVVEGSVVRIGSRVRVTAQLIDAATDQHVWVQSYERDADDVLALQAEVAKAIAEEVRIQLSPREQARLSAGRPVHPRAYEAYLLGRYHWNRRTASEIRLSLEYFEKAIEADPEYARAHAGVADAYNIMGDQRSIAPQDAASRALAAANRALQLDPQLAEAHTSLGFVRFFYQWDWEGAETAFTQALMLNPGYATAHQWYGEAVVAMGRFDEAVNEAKRARELDPLAIIMGTSLGDVLFFARRYDEALAAIRSVLAVDPDFPPANTDLGRVLTLMGRYDEALACFERAAAAGGTHVNAMPGRAYTLALAGRADEARQVLEGLMVRRSERYESPHAIAVVHLGLGQREQALDWLETAWRERDRALVWMKVHPRLDPLRAEPRFQELLRRMNFPA